MSGAVTEKLHGLRNKLNKVVETLTRSVLYKPTNFCTLKSKTQLEAKKGCDDFNKFEIEIKFRWGFSANHFLWHTFSFNLQNRNGSRQHF